MERFLYLTWLAGTVNPEISKVASSGSRDKARQVQMLRPDALSAPGQELLQSPPTKIRLASSILKPALGGL
jgi:hypothetical protein